VEGKQTHILYTEIPGRFHMKDRLEYLSAGVYIHARFYRPSKGLHYSMDIDLYRFHSEIDQFVLAWKNELIALHILLQK
jgi:hypothetical protein